MARPTYAEAQALIGGDLLKAMAILISQQEPDGTAVTSAVDIVGGAISVEGALTSGTPITGETIPSGGELIGWLSSQRIRLDAIEAATEAALTTLASETTAAATGTVLGATGDAMVAAGASGSTSAKLRRLTNDIEAVRALLAGTLTVAGTVTATVAGVATDTVLAAVRDRLPATLGTKTSANALATVTASDDAVVGPVAETAPASDTASSGLNGRLQRVAQNLTTLIGRTPASLGQKAMSASFAVALASDHSNVPISQATVELDLFADMIADADGILIVKNSSGRIKAVTGDSIAAASAWLLGWDNATTTSGTLVFRKRIGTGTAANPVSASLGRDLFGPSGKAFTNGLVVSVSTSPTSQVAPADPTHFDMQIAYI